MRVCVAREKAKREHHRGEKKGAMRYIIDLGCGAAGQYLNLWTLLPQRVSKLELVVSTVNGSALPTAPHPDALFLALSHNFI